MAMYSERTLRERAKRIGYYVEKGYQQYVDGSAFILDESGNKITGYDLYNPDGYSVNAPYPSTSCHDHEFTLDELERYLKRLYRDRNLKW